MPHTGPETVRGLFLVVTYDCVIVANDPMTSSS